MQLLQPQAVVRGHPHRPQHDLGLLSTSRWCPSPLPGTCIAAVATPSTCHLDTPPLVSFNAPNTATGVRAPGLSGIRDLAFCPETPWEGLAQISIEAGRPFRREAYSEELIYEKNM